LQRAEAVPVASKYAELVAAARTLAGLLHTDPATLPEHPVRVYYVEGLAALRRGDEAQAMEAFLEVIIRHKAYLDESARKACIALFHFWGPGHALTAQYRKRFDMALY